MKLHSMLTPFRILALTLGVASLAGCGQAPGQKGVATDAITIHVTEKGFEPPVIKVPAGRPVYLEVTRKTDRTCAKEFVMAEYHINQPLPLNQAVTISFTPDKAGELRYACGMDMFSGRIVVE